MIKRNIPKVRFKQFCDFWKTYKLGNLGSVAMNKRIFKEETSEVGEIPFYKIGTFGSEPNSFITREKFDEYKSKYPYPEIGDILISASGSIGRTVEYLGEEAYFQDSNIVWLKHDERLDNSFLKQFYSIVKWQGIEGTTIKRLYNKNILETQIALPSISEQSAIGSLFRTLDDLLDSYKDNLVNYQSLKATMLSKMFSKAGQTVPEIRLDGFEGEWEEKYIGELADIVRGASPRPIQDPKWFDTNSEIGWLRISDVTSQNGRIYSLEQKISKLGQEKTRVLTEPHLLLSIAATVGKPVVNYVKTGVHDGFLIFMNPKFDREFMFQWLEMFREKWNRYGQPGSQVNLNSDIVKNQKILVPCMEEQQAIGSYFNNLDNLIASHQEKISQLETLKKKLLQDMFI